MSMHERVLLHILLCIEGGLGRVGGRVTVGLAEPIHGHGLKSVIGNARESAEP